MDGRRDRHPKELQSREKLAPANGYVRITLSEDLRGCYLVRSEHRQGADQISNPKLGESPGEPQEKKCRFAQGMRTCHRDYNKGTRGLTWEPLHQAWQLGEQLWFIIAPDGKSPSPVAPVPSQVVIPFKDTRPS